MSSFARDHLEDLIGRDPTLYKRACSIVLAASKAWRCSIEHLLGYERSPQMDQVRAAMTLVIREQTCLSLDDIALVVARDDHASMNWRIRQANAGMMRRLDPIYSAYWSLVGHLRKIGFALQGRPSIAERAEESITLDLSPYLTRPEGVLTAARIRASVCESLDVDLSQVLSGHRFPEHVEARMFSYAIMRVELEDFSLPQIARALKITSHSSVHTAIKRLIKLFAEESEYASGCRDRFARCCDDLGIDPSSYPAKLLDRSFPRSAPDTPTRETAGSPGRAPEADPSASGNVSQGEHSPKTTNGPKTLPCPQGLIETNQSTRCVATAAQRVSREECA